MRAVRQLIGITAAGMLFAGALEAQTPRHEFGIDLGIASAKPDDGERALVIGTPIDVRVGFVTASPWMLETRFSFEYIGVDEGSALSFVPGVNLLWRLGPGTGLANQMGPYVTVGGSAEYSRFSSDAADDSESATQFGLNVGIGTRLAWGTAAFRPELFFAKVFESGDIDDDEIFLPAGTAFGLRVGISLWR
jgi:hypothetical protein